MLKLILGLSGTGKSYTVYNEIKRLAENGENSVLIVPEQFTQGAEIRIYRLLGDKLSSFVFVCSFSSYAEHILKKYGGAAVKTLSDAGRVVYVRRAMDAVADKLLQYGSHRRSVRFCTMCADVITELKTAGATPQDLLSAAQDVRHGADKLSELSLIYSAYNVLLENTALDPADRIALAADKPVEQEVLALNIFVDNFDGFTAPEYKLFNKLMQARQCTVTLCCESLYDEHGGLSLTSPVKKTAARLRSAAAKTGVPVAPPVVLQKDMRHVNSRVLAAIADIIIGSEPQNNEAADGMFFVNAYNSRYAEAKAAAAHIFRMASQGEEFGEFAIICRELDKYEAPLKRELSLFNIPFFTDDTKSVENTAPASFLRAALSILKNGLSGEGILRMLKTGLCGINENELAALENYAFTWQLTAQCWREKFTKNPSGFGDMSEEDRKLLAVVENLRSRIMPPVEKFIKNAKSKSAQDISRALYYLLESFNAAENTLISAQSLTENGSEELGESVCRAWDLAMEFLSEMPLLLQGCDVSAAEYDELLLLLMQSAKIGAVPQVQNAVLITTADRMRLESPRCCFVLGVSEGEFPKAVGASGLLTHADRDALVKRGIEMPGGFENRMLLEQMFFYKAFTAAKLSLYASFVPAQYGGGEQAAQLSEICRILQPQPASLSYAELSATPAAALDYLGEQGFADTPCCAALCKALEHEGTQTAALCAMRRAKEQAGFFVSDTEALRRTLTNRLTISPTRIERWHSCRFSYFMEYVLRIRPRKKAELSPLESGSLVHYVLENFLREAGGSFRDMPKDRLRAISSRLIDDYVQDKMPDTSLRFGRIILRIKENIAKLLEYIQAEQAQSLFEPVAFEEAIGGEGGIKPLSLTTPTGEIINVVGKIDRVDVMQSNGVSYIRVVDYKTGSKRFSLSDVFCGLNMQMLIYLFTVCKNGGAKYENACPAGVLYLLADPAPETVLREKAFEPVMFETDGILLKDENVLKAMDKQAQGVFIPVRFDKYGNARKSAKLASLEKLGRIEQHIEELLTQMATRLYKGDIEARPLVIKDKRPCDVCDYRPVCRHEDGFCEEDAALPDDLFEPENEAQDISGEAQE